ncbi:MAG: alpha-amlyase [Alphaproteobacteria bacterium]|nr:MAG: alpha-amlyase [Alphaproteobacteria bacterium]
MVRLIRYIFSLLMVLVISGGVFITGTQANNVIERVEPPFWWGGFENPALQLLVYGKNISEFEPEVDHKGVTLEKTTRVKSPNYLFIDLKIAKDSPSGTFEIVFKHQNGQEITYAYELKARRENSAARKGFDSSDVIYLITPDRFANGNTQNDSITGMVDAPNRGHKDGRHGGDIQGIIDHLDYISDMGFTLVWPTPLLENNQPRTSYHGYAITDFYKQDPRFGANAEYINLSKQVRAKDMGLIMDMVANHVGSEHWWMKDIPTDDWVNFYTQGYVQSNHIHNTIHDPYAAKWDKDRFSDGWFDRAMPDLNQRNPLLANYLIQNAIWWIEYADLAGVRMDTYAYPDKDFSAQWASRIMAEYPDFNLVGEEYRDNRTMIAYWQKGKVNKDGYVSVLPGLMDFPLQSAMVKALREKESGSEGLKKLYEALSMDNQYADPDNMVIMSDNHDMDRLYTQLGEDFDLYKMAIAYTLTMRGIPQVFYGTEILKTNPGGKDDGVIRSDFPGGWAGDKVNAFTGDGLNGKQKAAQDFVRKLVNWRKNKKVIHEGRLMHFIPENGVYVYFRYDDKDKVMVVLNKNRNATSLNMARFSEMLKDHIKATDVITGKTVNVSQEISLMPRSVMVLEVK